MIHLDEMQPASGPDTAARFEMPDRAPGELRQEGVPANAGVGRDARGLKASLLPDMLRKFSATPLRSVNATTFASAVEKTTSSGKPA